MANVVLTFRYPDGAKACVEIYVDDSFPDALDEARSQAVRAMREIVGEDAGARLGEESDELGE